MFVDGVNIMLVRGGVSAAILSILACDMASASIITVSYTGSYVGTWSGNYDPRDPQFLAGGLHSGPMGSGQFALTFTFDTELASAGHFASSVLDNSTSGSPSVGSGLLAPLGILTGNYFASDSASEGRTTQIATNRYVGRGGAGVSPTISMTAINPDIPADILTPFRIESAIPLGSGYASYLYESAFYGGGVVTYELTPYAIEVSVNSTIAAVPEPATWAMLIIGFVGVGYAGWRSRQRALICR